MEYLGKNGNFALFANEDQAAIIDDATKVVVSLGSRKSLFASAEWVTYSQRPSDTATELANAALTDLDIHVFANNDRLYTIPDAVIAEAKRGLEWRKEEKRGGTPVGLNTARTLARGGQIGIKKVRHIAKYFPRHEVDKKGKGYKPGQDNYPSNGRIAWALWGGDAAQRWASAIVERENNKKKNASITASHGLYDYDPMESRVDYHSFMPSEYEPDFYIRIRLDGSGIDRLYKVDEDGACRVWDDGYWDDLGNINHDFITYDKSLDDPYDQVQKIHIPVDRESAIKISAMLDNTPFENISIQMIDFDENDIFEQAIPEIDWKMVDTLSEDEIEEVDLWDQDGLLAVGAPTTEAPTNQDGDYTPEERSEKAQRQVRDKLGQFAKAGSTVIIGGNPQYTGKITALNPETQEVSVQLANDQVVSVPANTTQEVSTFEPVSQANFPENNLDFSGILGEPRVAIDQPTAMLPGRLPPLTAPDVNLLVNDWSAWVAGQRLSPEYAGDPEPPFIPKEVPDYNTAMGRYYQAALNPDGTFKNGWTPALAPNLYNEPLLRDWLDSKYGNSKSAAPYTSRGGWYKERPDVEARKSAKEVNSKENREKMDKKWDPFNFSITASGEVITPENSDVPPMYMAIVAEDDPQAVMELISLQLLTSVETTNGNATTRFFRI
jgi:hypothetical protein